MLGVAELFSVFERTRCTGAMRVVGANGEATLWVEDGDAIFLGDPGVVLDALIAATEGGAVGEFAFEITSVPASAEHRVTLDVLGASFEVRARDWNELALPFEAIVVMAATPPDSHVTIGADDWQVLSTVGTARRTVREVLDAIDGSPFDILSKLRVLIARQLITLEGVAPPLLEAPVDAPAAVPDAVPPPPPPPPPPPDPATRTGAGDRPPLLTVIAPARHTADPVFADVIMPPPISGDPWSLAPTDEPIEVAG